MNIAVYCGASEGNNPAFRTAAEELGTWIAKQGHTLVYGGGKLGSMGTVADAVLAAGGRVIGVIPDFLATPEQLHAGLTKTIHVPTMAERKTRMIEFADAFVALPGGVGTLEELSEIISRIHLNLTGDPFVFFDPTGYYGPLYQMLERMVECDFFTKDNLQKIHSVRNTAELGELLAL